MICSIKIALTEKLRRFFNLLKQKEKQNKSVPTKEKNKESSDINNYASVAIID